MLHEHAQASGSSSLKHRSLALSQLIMLFNASTTVCGPTSTSKSRKATLKLQCALGDGASKASHQSAAMIRHG